MKMITSIATKPVIWPHLLVAAEVFMLSVVIGIVGGWTSSPYLAKLMIPNAELPVTTEDNLFATLLNIGRLAGALTGAVMINYFGSKKATLCTGVPTVIVWILLTIGHSISLIHLSRVLSGFGLGMYFSTFPVYMGEISNPKIRGALVSFIAQGLPFGILLGNLIGAYMPIWILTCFNCFLPNIIFLGLFALIPDTPHYLILQGRMGDAKKSLEWYNRYTDVTSELKSLENFMSYKKATTFSEKIDRLFVVSNLKALAVVSIVFTFMQLSGLWTISFNMQIILTNAGMTTIDPEMVVFIIAVLGIALGWELMCANDKYGRKIMLGASAFGISLAYLILGINYQLLDLNIASKFVTQWLPIIAITVFQCSLCIGVVPVPFILMSEMFSPDIKSTATCFVNVCSTVFAFITSNTYESMIAATSEQHVFWFYGLVMINLAIYSIIFMPETKCKSLQKIQEMLTQKKINSTETNNSP